MPTHICWARRAPDDSLPAQDSLHLIGRLFRSSSAQETMRAAWKAMISLRPAAEDTLVYAIRQCCVSLLERDGFMDDGDTNDDGNGAIVTITFLQAE